MPKILFVEDDPFIAEIYKKKFESSQFEVVNVTTGKAVLREVKENKYDLVLLDLVIPEMSGMEVLEEMRTKPEEYPQNLKIIVFSNLSSPEDRDKCLQLGANGFISKTEFSPSEVVEEINRFLRQFSEQEKNMARTEGSATTSSDSQSAKKRILIIEDEAVFVEMFSKRLKDEGYEVVSKPEGLTGLEEAMKGGYDLVISDIMMPGMQGNEVIAKLRESEQGKNVPVIILSASVEEDHFQELSAAGIANRVFMKTQVTPSELAYHVNDLLKEVAK